MSEQDMQPPAGHPTAEHGKGGGTCPFAGMITALASGEVNDMPERTAKALAEIGAYGQVLNKLQTRTDSSLAQFYEFADFRSTKSFSLTLTDTHAPGPGIETFMHKMHSQLRLMSSRVGHLLDADALTPESGHGVRTDIASMIKDLQLQRKKNEKLCTTLFKDAERIPTTSNKHKTDRGYINWTYYEERLGKERVEQVKSELQTIGENIDQLFISITAELNALTEVPISTPNGPVWVANYHPASEKSVAADLWHLALSSESQLDPVKTGFDEEIRGTGKVSGTSNTTGITDAIITTSLGPLLQYLSKTTPTAVEPIINQTMKNLREAFAQNRDPILGYLASYELRSERAGRLDMLPKELRVQLFRSQTELEPKRRPLSPAETARMLRAAAPDNEELAPLIEHLEECRDQNPAHVARAIQKNHDWKEAIDNLNPAAKSPLFALLNKAMRTPGHQDISAFRSSPTRA
ncbi:MAG: hypothetical protein SFT92_02010 [Rickettsiales bacterium]|nr:hypothetical protein [Rickettsiales bacterium]